MPEPLYKKVYNTIVERIADSDYLPGAMLPSEFDIADELSVSQGTARKALTALEQKGIVERRQGKGTFVALRTPENSLFHFFSLRAPDGSQVAPQLVTEDITLRPARQAEKTALFGDPKKVYQIDRVRSFAGRPLCSERIILPVDLFPGLKERAPLKNALYVLYQQSYSCIIVSAEEDLTAGVLDADKAEALQRPEGTPVIVAKRRARDLRDRIVELRVSTFVTDTASYFVDLK